MSKPGVIDMFRLLESDDASKAILMPPGAGRQSWEFRQFYRHMGDTSHLRMQIARHIMRTAKLRELVS